MLLPILRNQTFYIQLQLAVKSDKYDLYDGADENEVLAEYEQHRSSWAISPFSWKQKDIKLNPFNQSCVGIYSSEEYGIYLNIFSKFPYFILIY
jgi:hypothetical protein